MTGIVRSFIEVFRWLLWILATAILKIADILYVALKHIASYDFLNMQIGNSSYQIKDYYTYFMGAFFGFFIIFRLTKRYLKSVVNEQEAQSLKPISIISKAGVCGILLIALPTILGGFSSFSNYCIENVERAVNVSDGNFSTIMLTSVIHFEDASLMNSCPIEYSIEGDKIRCVTTTNAQNMGNSPASEKEWNRMKDEWEKAQSQSTIGPYISSMNLTFNPAHKTYQEYVDAFNKQKLGGQIVEEEKSIYDIDINEKKDDHYVILDNWADFFIICIGSFASCYIMVLIAFQIAGRYLSMLLKLIIAPYSISSVIEGNDESFQNWWKLFVADFLANYLQMLLLLIVTTVFIGFDFETGNGTTDALASILVYCGALVALLNAPAGISQLIGADMGMNSAMQGLQTIMTGTRILTGTGKMIGGAALGAAGFVGTKALVGVGRKMGFKTDLEISSEGNTNKLNQLLQTAKNGVGDSGGSSPGVPAPVPIQKTLEGSIANRGENSNNKFVKGLTNYGSEWFRRHAH